MKSVMLAMTAAAVLAVSAQAWGQDNNASQVPAQSSVTSVSKKSARAANRKLEHDIRKAFAKTKGLDSSDIMILVKAGNVSLTGSVPEIEQIAMAEDVAKNVEGVQSVKNYLNLKEIGQ